MLTAVSIGADAPRHRRNWSDRVDFVVEAERLGVDACWSAESWGEDAFTPLAFLAAKTSRIALGTGIAQISTRVPSMMAMTALTMAEVSGGRFRLGLGVSGPQVVEGLHGVAFARPLARLREYLDVLHLAFAGEKLRYDGSEYSLPRPGGEGRALRLAQPANPGIAIHLAVLSPRGLALAGERADGWVGTSFVPEAAEVFLGPMRDAAHAAGRDFSAIDIQAGGALAFDDEAAPALARAKTRIAFAAGAMGSERTNFYLRAYQRAGFATATTEVQRLWLEGRRDDAVLAVPDELALSTSFIGSDAEVLDRLRAFRDAGVTTVRLEPAGRTLEARLETLAHGLELVRRVTAEPGG